MNRKKGNTKKQITRQHINNGKKNHARGCAIALALKEEFIYASVAGWINVEGKCYLTQDELRDWIADFDKGKPVKPITVELIETYVLDKFNPLPDIKICGIARMADTPVTYGDR